MILCIDIGNTNIVIGLYEDKTSTSPKNKWRVHTDPRLSSDEYGIKLLDIIEHANVKKEEIEGAIISSVVPQMDDNFIRSIEQYLHISPLLVGQGIKSGIHIKIDNPKQLGADLLVGAAAAVEKYKGQVLIIDIGTAATFTIVNEKKELLGGIILPGIQTSYSGLFSNAQKLEKVRIAKPKNIIGRDTISCIQSGMVYGTASMLDGLVRKIKEEYGPTTVVITGGEARYLLDILEEQYIYDDDLLLDGLKILYYKNIN